jgi:hypothetical protein
MATRAGIALRLPGWAEISSPAGPAPARPSGLLRPACPGRAFLPCPDWAAEALPGWAGVSIPGWAGKAFPRVGRRVISPGWASQLPPGRSMHPGQAGFPGQHSSPGRDS